MFGEGIVRIIAQCTVVFSNGLLSFYYYCVMTSAEQRPFLHPLTHALAHSLAPSLTHSLTQRSFSEIHHAFIKPYYADLKFVKQHTYFSLIFNTA